MPRTSRFCKATVAAMRLPPEQRPVPCHQTRFVQTLLLRNFGFADIEAFWERHRLTLDNRTLTVCETACHVWDFHNTVSLPFFAQVFHDAKRLCLSRGIDFIPAIQELVSFMGGTTAPPSLLLLGFSPVLRLAAKSKDLRIFCFEIMESVNDRTWPGHVYRLVRMDRTDTEVNAYSLAGFTRDAADCRFAHIDAEAWAGVSVREFPTTFGYPRHQSYRMLADVQPFLAILIAVANLRIPAIRLPAPYRSGPGDRACAEPLRDSLFQKP